MEPHLECSQQPHTGSLGGFLFQGVCASPRQPRPCRARVL